MHNNSSNQSDFDILEIDSGALNIQSEQLSELQKIEAISTHFKAIMNVLGLDTANDSLRDTPNRVAKMYVNEIFWGLNPKNKPKITLFDNDFEYTEAIIEANIPFTSFCEHHFVPIVGTAFVGYIPNKKVIGLSKLHRLVDFFARKPQVQERLTNEIAKELAGALQLKDVAVVLKANHSCISCRGIGHQGSNTYTAFYSGTDILKAKVDALAYN